MTSRAEQRRDFAPIEMTPVPGMPYTYATKDGDIYSNHPGSRWKGKKLHKLKPMDNGRGYMRVQCHGRRRCTHLLIAATFIGPKPAGMEVNHIDGDKLNNRPSNLEYVTRSENMKHCFRVGLGNPPHGETHHRAKLSDASVARLRHDYVMLLDGLERMPNGAMKHLERKYDISDSAIRAVVRMVTWKQ